MLDKGGDFGQDLLFMQVMNQAVGDRIRECPFDVQE